MNRIVKNSFFNLIYTFLNVAFPLITSMYISRVLLPEGVGVVSYAQTIVSYFVTFASTGMSIYGLREFAKARDDLKERNKVYTELFIFNAVATAAALVMFTVLVFSVGEFRSEMLLYFACGLLLIFQFMNIDWMYQGLEHYGYITARSFIIKSVSFVCILLLVKTKDDYVLYALISSLAIGSNNAFIIIHSRKYVRFCRGVCVRRHIAPTLYIAACSYLSTLYNKVDITMLGAITSDQCVGYYSYAYKIIEVILMMCVAISTVFMPQLSIYYQNDKEKFERLVDMGIRILLFITLPVFMGVFILAPYAVTLLYGEAFEPSYTTVRILSLMIIIKPLANLLCYQLMISTGNEKKRLPAFIAAVVMNIALNAFMIPLWQHNGAAIASVISELVVNALQLIVIVRVVRIRFNLLITLKIILSTVIMIPVVVFATLIISDSILRVLVPALAGAAVYLLSGILFKNELMMQMFDVIKQRLKKSRKAAKESDR